MTKKKKTSFEAQAAQQIKDEAHRIATGIKITGQTREQTKLIARGIEKGIALYKNQERTKARARDKIHRKSNNTVSPSATDHARSEAETQHPPSKTNAKQRTRTLITAGIVFLLVGVAHAGRLLANIAVNIGGYEIPELWSLPLTLISLALAYWMFVAAR